MPQPQVVLNVSSIGDTDRALRQIRKMISISGCQVRNCWLSPRALHLGSTPIRLQGLHTFDESDCSFAQAEIATSFELLPASRVVVPCRSYDALREIGYSRHIRLTATQVEDFRRHANSLV
jgi:hypothetical protein